MHTDVHLNKIVKTKKKMFSHHLVVKHGGVVQLVEFGREVFLILLKFLAVAGARLRERLQEAAWSFTRHEPARKRTNMKNIK